MSDPHNTKPTSLTEMSSSPAQSDQTKQAAEQQEAVEQETVEVMRESETVTEVS